jgi:carotenoid cleavage dioxygenase
MAGHFKSTKVPTAFPELPQFSEFMKPCRFEGEIQNLPHRGQIPDEIDGTFYRVMPDPQFPSFIENDPVCDFSTRGTHYMESGRLM